MTKEQSNMTPRLLYEQPRKTECHKLKKGRQSGRFGRKDHRAHFWPILFGIAFEVPVETTRSQLNK